ncbi:MULTISPECIES: ABC transporter permease [unclassified Lactococcus]|uniref:ABC transporter permease n=1 Tax=unclassified Lactococcus TaxID=2643510 RepID=UPI0011C842FF|nr:MULTISPECIES: ABC transporter permease [unclassified Lactococcus]MQW23824.1 ABC transporter permease subunit [Lactococcus sp. dk101]TXK37350.1 ABC transporter permease [Lactococcus sp. dk310]TXK48662.1 ABC transporter permease [Lactococcus sp. dk322]
MLKYTLGRILRGLFSVFMVTTLTYMLVYTLIPRHMVFNNDANYNKIASVPDKRTDYENTIYDKMGYIQYLNTRELIAKADKSGFEASSELTDENKTSLEKWAKKAGGGWTIKQMPKSKAYYAVREIPLYERVGRFYGQMIQIDNIWHVQDKSNPDLKRGYSMNTKGGFALIGSGTKYKYQIYTDKHFPYIHQNIVHLYLGQSFPSYDGQEVLKVIEQGQGEAVLSQVNFPEGKMLSSANIHTAQYRSPSKTDAPTKAKFGSDPYSLTENNYADPSMLTTSFLIGTLALIITYGLGIPLSILFARKKGTWIDGLGNAFIILSIALPSLAFVYFLQFIGGSIGLPTLFPDLGAQNPLSYVLPVFILSAISIGGTIQWIRRFMIDQSLSDYVRFARAKGLTEREISNGHIMKNAMIPIVQGIPVSIIASIGGATITETIFNVPGMGKLLPAALLSHNNAMVVGLTFIFTLTAVIALIVGDLLMTVIDPRINLTVKKRGEK